MKKYIAVIAVALLAVGAQAQTNFVNSVEAYFTSFNTNYGFGGVKLELSSGYAQVTGANAASKLFAQYDINSFDVIGSVQFSGVGSALNGGESGVGYTIISHYDTKVQIDLLAGYDNTKLDGKGKSGAIVVEPRIALKKKLTQNTYAETTLSLPIFSVGRFNSNPTIYAGVGFTY